MSFLDYNIANENKQQKKSKLMNINIGLSKLEHKRGKDKSKGISLDFLSKYRARSKALQKKIEKSRDKIYKILRSLKIGRNLSGKLAISLARSGLKKEEISLVLNVLKEIIRSIENGLDTCINLSALNGLLERLPPKIKSLIISLWIFKQELLHLKRLELQRQHIQRQVQNSKAPLNITNRQILRDIMKRSFNDIGRKNQKKESDYIMKEVQNSKAPLNVTNEQILKEAMRKEETFVQKNDIGKQSKANNLSKTDSVGYDFDDYPESEKTEKKRKNDNINIMKS